MFFNIRVFLGKDKNGDFMNIRTDLVTEENLTQSPDIKDLKTEKKVFEGIEIETTEIISEYASNMTNKPVGKYCTIRFERLDGISDTAPLKKAIIKGITSLCRKKNNNVLIVGLGNSDITPDALGPLCANSVIATRHISVELKKRLGLEGLHSVSCITPGVLGKTGIEAVDIIKAAVKATKPELVLAVDALAAKTPQNLCRTIQMTDSGIAPGSGVKNERAALNSETLGIPVVAVGIPTVIDANCFSENLQSEENMMVTPKEIDLLISRAAALLARALNMYFQPSLDEEMIESLS